MNTKPKAPKTREKEPLSVRYGWLLWGPGELSRRRNKEVEVESSLRRENQGGQEAGCLYVKTKDGGTA